MTKKIKCEVYSRIVGYFRPVANWNEGKTQEYAERVAFNEGKSLKSSILLKTVKPTLSCATC